MKFIFGAVGAVLGALMGGAFAALVGAALGVALAVMLADAEKKAERTSTAPRANAIETRVARLEQEVAALRAEVHRLTPASVVATPIVVAATPPSPEPEPMPEPEPQFVDTTPVAIDLPPEPPARPPRAPAPPSLSVEERLPSFLRQWIFGGNTIVKVGVLILFLGLAFLLRYAAERVTVPVELRYAGVALLGAVLLALGWRLRERKDAAGGSGYGLILQGAGVGVFYLTTLAALKLNQLLPPELAFGFLFMVAVLSAVLAVAQNAPWLAYVAAAEGFAAPVLVSTGSGNQIALFSYLAVLDVGIVLMAWFRAWRPLNLIGFVGTFALAGAWAQRYYTDAHYPVTQAFLLLFFGLYTAVGVLFARRALALGPPPDAQHPLAQRAAQALANVGRVDSALVFGVPLASYGMQYLLVRHDEFGPAWAALGFALFYLLLGGVLLRRSPSRYSLLGEAYVIVSVIFGTLAIPLALEGAWTGATWAVEAAGMYWLGTRQQRRYARAFALLVLAGATLRLATSLQLDATPGAPLLVGSLLGMLLLCVSALAMFIVGQRARIEELAAWEAVGHVAQLWIGLAAAAAMAWLVFAPVWACVATSLLGVVALRIGLRWSQSPAFAVAWCALQLGAGLSFLAFGPELWAAQSASLTLWTPLVLALAALISGDAMQRDKNAALRAPWVQWAVVLWSLAWWTQVLPPDAYRALRRTQSDWALLWPAVLTGWVLLSSMLVTLLARWRDWRVLGQSTWVSVPAWVLTAWLGVGLGGYAPHAHLGWLVWPLALAWHMVLLRTQTRWWSANALAPLHVGGFWLFVLLAAREAQWWTASWGEPGSAWPLLGWALVPALVLSLMTRPRMLQRWPLAAFRDAYLLVACAPLAVYLLAWLWASNTQSGAAAPLPYVPLLNPLELGHGLVLLSLFLWRGALPAQAIAPRPLLLAGLGATAFALYTGVVLRTCHHWAGVPWDSHALFASTLTQAALSVAWSIVGVALMLFGHRRVQRGVWIVGAALLGVVVAKLFFVELADRGGLYRIVSFIVVGLLLLTVGYFAPVPPNRDDLRSKA